MNAKRHGEVAEPEIPDVVLSHIEFEQPPASREHGLTPTEAMFLETAKVNGMKVGRHGWPSFLLERIDHGYMAVEVKGGSDTINPRQARMFAMLERSGIQVYVWRSGIPDRLIWWKKDIERRAPTGADMTEMASYIKQRKPPVIPDRSRVRVVGLTASQRAKLRGRTFASERVIQKWADGALISSPTGRAGKPRGITRSTSASLYRACRELGIETHDL